MTKPENNSSTNVMKPEKKRKCMGPVGFRFSYKALNRSCSVILPPKLLLSVAEMYLLELLQHLDERH